MPSLYFLSHPEVSIDPNVDIQQWGLSDKGQSRLQKALELPWLKTISAIYSSKEKKAVETAQVFADFTHLDFTRLEELGEMDRSSTGYLPFVQFDKLVEKFFHAPYESVEGWEKAIDAQNRITVALDLIMAKEKGKNILICSHGGVGALALSSFKGRSISREEDQPGSGGGNYFVIDTETKKVLQDWTPIDGQ